MSPAGVTVTTRESAPSRTVPTDISPGFAVVATEKGPLLGEARSLADFISQWVGADGRTSTYAIGYDGAELFFAEGGNVLHVSRLLGVTPVKASKTFENSSEQATIKVEAANYGAYYNGWEVAVEVVSTTFRLVVTDSALDDQEVVTTPYFASVTEAAAWAQTSGPENGPRTDINVTDDATGSGNPDAATATALTGGTDDIGNASSATRKTAIDRFPRDLGPGQIAVWGDTTAQTALDLDAHGAANNRVVVADLPDVASTSTVISAADSVRDGAYSGRELLVWPWANVGGLLAGQIRKVPYSAIQMGIIARNDADGMNPNDPAAADSGASVTALSLSQLVPVDAATLDDLADAGVNPVKRLRTASGGSVIELYDYITAADPSTHPQRVDFGTARLIMAITARAEAIGLPYVLKLITPLSISKFQGELQAMLKAYWESGALYGLTAPEAYVVDTGPSVNTAETIAAKKLRASISIRPSVPGREVEIDMVTFPITAQLG